MESRGDDSAEKRQSAGSLAAPSQRLDYAKQRWNHFPIVSDIKPSFSAAIARASDSFCRNIKLISITVYNGDLAATVFLFRRLVVPADGLRIMIFEEDAIGIASFEADYHS